MREDKERQQKARHSNAFINCIEMSPKLRQ